MFCIICGTKIRPGTIFCESCEKLYYGIPDKPQEPSPDTSGNTSQPKSAASKRDIPLDTLLKKVNRFIERKDHKNALRILEYAKAQYPDSYEVYDLMGLSYRSQGDHKSAIECYKKAASLEPDNGTIRMSIGLAMILDERPQEALPWFGKALPLMKENRDSKYPVALGYYSYALAKSGYSEKAVSCLKEAERLGYPNAFSMRRKFEALGIKFQDSSQKSSQQVSRGSSKRDSLGSSQNTSSASNKSISLDKMIETANRYLEVQNYKNALSILNYAKAQYPDSAGVYNLMGLSYRGQGDNESAIECYKKAASLEPDNGTIRMNIGVALLLDEKAKDSLPWFEKALPLMEKSKDNNYPVALGNYSYALAKAGYSEKAVRYLKEAERLGYPNISAIRSMFDSLGIKYTDPSQEPSQQDSQEAPKDAPHQETQDSKGASQDTSSAPDRSISLDKIIETANRYLEARDYKNALSILNNAKTQYPDSGEVYNLIGLTYRGQGDLKSAIEYYKKAASLEPDNGTFPMNVGIAMIFDERPQKSFAWFEKAMSLMKKNKDSNYPVALANYSYALAKSGYFDKAVSCLEEAERLGYRNAGAMWNMFRSLGIIHQDPSQKNSSASGKFISLDETIETANRYLEAKNYKNALNILNYAKAQYPNSGKVYNLMGLSYRGQGDYKSAIECYKKAASLEPDNGTFQMNIGIAMIFDEKPQKSFVWFEKAMSLMKKNKDSSYPVALANYSYALAKSGYSDKAVGCLKEAERLGYRNAGAMWNMFRSLGIKSD